MPHPTQRTRTALVERLPIGVTVVRIDADAIQSVQDAKDNIHAAVQIALPQKLPLLVDIRKAKTLEADVRHYYSGQILIDSFQALCMLLDITPLGRMMGNLYMKVAKPGIPTHLSEDEAEAVNWLQQYCPAPAAKQ
jgi:hypothetical protein